MTEIKIKLSINCSTEQGVSLQYTVTNNTKVARKKDPSKDLMSFGNGKLSLKADLDNYVSNRE